MEEMDRESMGKEEVLPCPLQAATLPESHMFTNLEAPNSCFVFFNGGFVT